MSSTLDRKQNNDDEVLDSTLRPSSWADYVGQDKIKKNISRILTIIKEKKLLESISKESK